MRGSKHYFYFHSFSWNEPSLAGMKYPIEGRVYAGAKVNKSYAIPFEDNTGLYLEEELMKGSFETWDCDVEEVTLENLLDLPITAGDVKMMAEDAELNLEEQPSERDLEVDMLEEMGSSLFMLKEDDSDAYEAFVKVFTMLADSYSSRAYVALTEDLSWNPQTGKMANITMASYQLESYLNEKDPTKIGDLLNAIYTLMIEVIRKHKELKNSL